MIRLDRFLTEQNIASRSEAKELCKKGMVTVNDQICKKSDLKINPDTDRVCVGKKLIEQFGERCYMLNKPAGYVSAVSDAKEETVLAFFEGELKKCLFPIGRLDKDSEGMLLLTNMGKLCHALTSPAKHVPKTYEVWITGELEDEALKNLREGTDIGDETCCLPAEVSVEEVVEAYTLSEKQKQKLPGDTPERIRASRVRITITEGRFHQVKRMFHANRHEVFSLKRLSIGGLQLDSSLGYGE